MDPRTILAICISLIAAGNTALSLLSIMGLTKTEVRGGAVASTVYLAALVASTVGGVIFLILLITNGATVYNAIRFLLGG